MPPLRSALLILVASLAACTGAEPAGPELGDDTADQLEPQVCEAGVERDVGVLVCNLHGIMFGEDGLLDLIRSSHHPAVGRSLSKIYAEGVDAGGRHYDVDVVALQEVFEDEAFFLESSNVGFPNAELGPTIKPGGNVLDLLSGSELASHLGSALGYTQHAGLVTLSRLPMSHAVNAIYRDVYQKEFGEWDRPCTSVDCLADKGLSVTAHTLEPGCEPLYLVNTHLQAGKIGDSFVDYPERVRAYQTRKLLARLRSFVNMDSVPRHIAAVGDFNYMDQRSWGGPDEYETNTCAWPCEQVSGPAVMEEAGFVDSKPGSRAMMHAYYRQESDEALSIEVQSMAEIWLRDPAHLSADGTVSGEAYIVGGPYPFEDESVNGVETGDKACTLVSLRVAQERGSMSYPAQYEGYHPTDSWAVELSYPYPNPFRDQTTLEYVLPDEMGTQAIQAQVFDLLGQPVRTLVDEPQPPGRYSVVWDGRDERGAQVASGVYIFVLSVNGAPARTAKLSLVR